MEYRFEWNLRAAPEMLWAFVSNTQRINRVLGLPPVTESVVEVGGEPVRIGRASQLGFSLRWRESPYQWVTGKRLSVLREYDEGPLLWLKSSVELTPDGAGTHLVQIIEAEPRGLLGRAAIALEVGIRSRAALDRVYRRIDALLAGELRTPGRVAADAFEEPESPDADVVRSLDAIERSMVDRGATTASTAALVDLVRYGAPVDIARIRPIALARSLSIDEDELLVAAFIGVECGLLLGGWDLICPSCRSPSSYLEALRALGSHGTCAACSLTYDLDLSSSVELVFRPHPDLRAADAGIYCMTSPAHAPHVFAQLTVKAGVRLVVPLALARGRWQIHVRGRPAIAFEVTNDFSAADRLSIELPYVGGSLPPLSSMGAQELEIYNASPESLVVRIEASDNRTDCVVASRALAHARFRAAFPRDILPAHMSMRASRVAIAALHTDRGDDLDARVLASGGTVLSTSNASTLAVFDDGVSAANAALETALKGGRAALDLGSAEVTSSPTGLAYGGDAVRFATEALSATSVGSVAVGRGALADPAVAGLFSDLSAREHIVVSDERAQAIYYRWSEA